MGKFEAVEEYYNPGTERFVFFDDTDMVIGVEYGFASGVRCASLCVFTSKLSCSIVEFYIPLGEVREAVKELADGEV